MAVFDPPMPQEIQDFQDQQGWGAHHLKWHLERWWYRFDAAQRASLEAQGFSEAERQEGDPGNGLDFLAMHRAMMQILIDEFPTHADLFIGWTTPPTDPFDPEDEVEEGPNGVKPPFPPEFVTAIHQIENEHDNFSDDDAFGLYVQTSRNQNAVGAGIHNYLHGRWQGITDELNLGNPEVNMKNARFWRLHGWIDAQWTAFRQAKALPDDQPEYVAALEAARQMMGAGDGHVHELAMAATNSSHRRSNPLELSRSLSRALWHATDVQLEGHRKTSLVDFDHAEVVKEPISGRLFVVVSGNKPYANMTVSLEPRVYTRKPEYWGIDVTGTLPDIGLPQVAPYVTTLPIMEIIGTKGIEVIGSHDSFRIEVQENDNAAS